MRASYDIMPNLTTAFNVFAASSSFALGNENNADPQGKIPGYAVAGWNVSYKPASQWTVYANVSNLFDRQYSTSGQLGQHAISGDNRFVNTADATMYYAPGAPRAGWVGVRWSFGGAEKSPGDKD
jgi:outer membrane receptor protein involved in Fe transport